MRNQLLCVLLGFLASCSISPTGRNQLTFMPKEQMANMGDQSFAQLQKKEKLSQDPQLQKKIECISRRVVMSMEGENNFSEWDVKVFKSDQINAFALPGKNIGVYTGLIEAAENNAQIASVIGHEVGHVIADHGNERVSQNLVVQGGLLAANIAIDAGNPQKNQLIMASLGLASQVGVLLPFSRKQESESDDIGIRLMASAGFDPRASVEFWQIMNKKAQGEPPELLSTHPANKSRIENLQAKMDEAMNIYEKNKDKYSECP